MPVQTHESPEVEELRQLGDHIATLAAHIEVATARLLEMIREFDARAGWGDGFLSCAHWLNYRIGLSLHAAREQVRTARALGDLPLIAGAFARGKVSYSKVRALTRVATPETEERLLTFATHGTAAHVERLASAWRRVDRNAETELTRLRQKSRALHVYQDGRRHGDHPWPVDARGWRGSPPGARCRPRPDVRQGPSERRAIHPAMPSTRPTRWA